MNDKGLKIFLVITEFVDNATAQKIKDKYDDFQAWCDECEVVRQKEGEWNDKSMAFAEIKVVCEKCYFEMKELNLGYR